MPELPEVETIRKILISEVVRKKITAIDFLFDGLLKSDKSTFLSLVNETFVDVKRKGKLLIFLFKTHAMFVHLRMEGKFYLLSEDDPNSRFARIVFHLDTNEKLCFDDMRKFGVMKVTSLDDFPKDSWITSLGEEPFFYEDAKGIYEKGHILHTPIKTLLMDQHFLAGIGNIYADEILYRAHIHPLTLSSHLEKEDYDRIIEIAKIVLKQAIEEQGSTIRSYHPKEDMNGTFQNRLLVYGKKGCFCPVCHSPFLKIFVGGRGTTFCPKCQIWKEKPIVLGLTGAIGSGKSTALEILMSFGASVISCDPIVHELYQSPKVKNWLKTHLGTNSIQNHEVNFSYLRNLFQEDPSKKALLEGFLYPLVKEKLWEFIFTSKTKVVVLEIPLLFESGFDDLCDATCAIQVSNADQRKNLEKRGQADIDKMLQLNYLGESYPYASYLTYYIDSKNNKKTLRRALKSIYQELIDRYPF